MLLIVVVIVLLPLHIMSCFAEIRHVRQQGCEMPTLNYCCWAFGYV
jgi:hypothetical protein